MIDTIIKASEITNLTDARYFSAWGVKWLGFNLDESREQHVSTSEFHAMREWLVGPTIVGEFGALTTADVLHKAIEELELKAIQVGQFTNFEEVEHLGGRLEIIREHIIEQASEIEGLQKGWERWGDLVNCFLLDLEKNRMSWQQLKTDHQALAALQKLAATYPILLSIRFEAKDLPEMLSEIPLHGISVKGGEEEKVGYKSFDELDDIYDVLLDANM